MGVLITIAIIFSAIYIGYRLERLNNNINTIGVRVRRLLNDPTLEEQSDFLINDNWLEDRTEGDQPVNQSANGKTPNNKDAFTVLHLLAENQRTRITLHKIAAITDMSIHRARSAIKYLLRNRYIKKYKGAAYSYELTNQKGKDEQ